MNVADSNPDGNPSSDDNQTAQQICRQIDQFAETLKSKVEEAARSGDSFDSLEREIHKMILSVGRQAVDLFVSRRVAHPIQQVAAMTVATAR